MKKILLGCISAYLLIIGILWFLWSEKKHMTNEIYERYDVSYLNDLFHVADADLMDSIVSDDDISDILDLEKKSDLILKANVKDRQFVGNGVINVCEVKALYQGDYKEKTILIYDYIEFWGDYYEGAVPLQIGEEYNMFLKPALNPNQKDTYIFTTISYGHFRLKEDVKSMTAYDNGQPMTVQQLSHYDHVGLNDKKLNTFQKLQKQVYQKYK